MTGVMKAGCDDGRVTDLDPRVRPAVADDLPAMAAIYRDYVLTTAITFELEPPTDEQWRTRFDGVVGKGLPFLVAEVDGEVLGYAYCSQWKVRPAYQRTVESAIYLAAAARGRGLGRLLYGELINACTALGMHRMIGVVADSGDPGSMRLHEKCGFREVGRLTEVGHKLGRWWDTVLFELKL